MPKQHMTKFASAKLRKENMFHSSFIILRIKGLLGSNIVDLVKAAHHERSHLDLGCLQFQLFIFCFWCL